MTRLSALGNLYNPRCRMLQLLNINNIALIDSLRVDFDKGLNLLTGETGSGKSIIVDALGLLIGGRLSNDLLKSGAERAFVEGSFILSRHAALLLLLQKGGITEDEGSEAVIELIVRREISATGRSKIFINNQLATQSLLRDLRPFLVDIHGQGDQQSLFNPASHLELLDDFAGVEKSKQTVAAYFDRWDSFKRQLSTLVTDEAKRIQLVDTLRYQIKELEQAKLTIGEDDELEDERRRLVNVEKLTSLSHSSYARIYEDDEAVLARLRQTISDIAELASYDSSFTEFMEPLESARATLEDLSFTLREFTTHLEFSPSRLSEIEDRLNELSRLKRKYGGSLTAALNHLAESQDRLRELEQSDERAVELEKAAAAARAEYFESAFRLHKERLRAARKLEKSVENSFKEVAMENSRFEVRINVPTPEELESSESLTSFRMDSTGIDTAEFYFSANIGEELKPLASVASGGEASRLMLVLKTVANAAEFPRTIVFDEIDAGIGGRVSEAVGAKLKTLSLTNQVLCVTHQPQIARFADTHLVVSKQTIKGQTRVKVTRLDHAGQVEEIARMLTGAEITETARRHARELLR